MPGELPVDHVVADRLRHLRTSAGFSQTAVANRMRAMGHRTWSKALVSELERHHRRILVSELVSLASIFDAGLYSFTGGTPPKPETFIPLGQR